MHVVLLRHGEAVPGEPDDDRKLTGKGRDDARRAGLFLGMMGLELPLLHSPLARTARTAEIAAGVLGTTSVATDGLLPSDDPSTWARKLARKRDGVILVGHQPHLGLLAATLMHAEAPGHPSLTIKKAGAACLQRDDSGAWSLVWLVTPGMLRRFLRGR